MPSQEKVWEYWKDRLEDFGVELYEPDQKSCFACGKPSRLHRAHIKPCDSQDDNGLDNIHLLCPSCHHLTEGYALVSEDLYWSMIRNKSYWLSDMMQSLCNMNLDELTKIKEFIYGTKTKK